MSGPNVQRGKSVRQRRPSRRLVQQFYAELREQERLRRERPNAIRELAWQLYTWNSRGCWSFWRTGFRNRFQHKIARGSDFTIVPGYDVLATAVAVEFPEFDADDGAARLFDLLFTPYDRMPSRDELWRRAEELARQHLQKNKVPF
jgi:hypothetical protein